MSNHGRSGGTGGGFAQLNQSNNKIASLNINTNNAAPSSRDNFEFNVKQKKLGPHKTHNVNYSNNMNVFDLKFPLQNSEPTTPGAILNTPGTVTVSSNLRIFEFPYPTDLEAEPMASSDNENTPEKFELCPHSANRFKSIFEIHLNEANQFKRLTYDAAASLTKQSQHAAEHQVFPVEAPPASAWVAAKLTHKEPVDYNNSNCKSQQEKVSAPSEEAENTSNDFVDVG